ncbi:MAG: glycosyltransferase family 9 protein [Planctomycetota bacterium]|nr:glycosyltransferase family 9 protein [Planctomycetota bacterium]
MANQSAKPSFHRQSVFHRQSAPERILIVRLSAVGDTILSLPILCALRDRFPESKIAWVVGKGASDLLRGHPDLDDLFVLSKDQTASPRAYWKFLQTIRQWKPDTSIDAQGLTKSAWIARFSGAKRRIGLCRSEFEGRELSTWLNNQLVIPEHAQVVLRGLELLKPLGIEAPEVEYRIPRDTQAISSVDAQFQGLDMPEHWGILNVGAGWPSKIWPTERYAAVARHLGERWGLPTWIAWGGQEEGKIAQAVVQASDSWARMMPPTRLLELAEWIRRARIFVGSDTGPMHLSVALDTPTIALIGPMPVERVGPLGPKHLGVQRDRLTEQERSNRKSDLRPMLSIRVEDVTGACDALVGPMVSAQRSAQTTGPIWLRAA